MSAAAGQNAPGRKSAADRPPVLELTDVTKSFGPLVAVDNLSLTIRPNEVVGLLGENGAGKSTLLKILTGVHRPDKGSIAVNGKTVSLRSPQDANAVGIGIVHQEQSLFTNLSVAENIVMGLSKQGPGRRDSASIAGGRSTATRRRSSSESAPRLTREQR